MRKGSRSIQALTRIGACVGAYCVYIRPGGLNPHGDWYAHPDNKAPATFERLVDSVRKACRTAETEGALLAIEGHVLSPLYSVERVCDLFEAVASPALRFNADPVNFLGTLEDVFDNSARLKLFDQLGNIPWLRTQGRNDQDRLVLHIDEHCWGLERWNMRSSCGNSSIGSQTDIC